MLLIHEAYFKKRPYLVLIWIVSYSNFSSTEIDHVVIFKNVNNQKLTLCSKSFKYIFFVLAEGFFLLWLKVGLFIFYCERKKVTKGVGLYPHTHGIIYYIKYGALPVILDEISSIYLLLF